MRRRIIFFFCLLLGLQFFALCLAGRISVGFRNPIFILSYGATGTTFGIFLLLIRSTSHKIYASIVTILTLILPLLFNEIVFTIRNNGLSTFESYRGDAHVALFAAATSYAASLQWFTLPSIALLFFFKMRNP